MTRATRSLRLLVPVLLLALPATSVAHDGDDPHAGATTVTEITATGARATASLVPGKETTQWAFRYGTSLSDVRATPVQSVPGHGSQPATTITVSAPLTGLSPATKYYIRLVAVARDRRSDGILASFTTAPLPAPAPGPATPGTPDPTAPVAPPAPPVPALGTSVVLGSADGRVRVRVPGSDFVPLGEGASVPVGSVVDARHGAVALSAALPGGAVQQARFGGGRFQIQQDATRGRTDLYLRGSFAGCRRASASGARGAVLASAARARTRRRVRSLWGRDDGGRFRTHGRDSVATVRGTRWTMTDRCDGTLTRVTEGAVDVRVRRTGEVVRVGAGHRHLARHAR